MLDLLKRLATSVVAESFLLHWPIYSGQVKSQAFSWDGRDTVRFADELRGLISGEQYLSLLFFLRSIPHTLLRVLYGNYSFFLVHIISKKGIFGC